MGYKIITSILLFATLACQNEPDNENESIWWVNSYKVECTGVGLQMCLQIQKGDQMEPGNWEYFYDEIQGFDWQPGFIYKLKVRKNELPPSQVPADASSIRYTLVEELQKESDPIVRLHDIWALESLDGQQWESNTLERPTLEIKLTTGKVMGTDGCNRYHGDIQKITRQKIELGPIASTKKACPDMALSDLFHQKMGEVAGYNREDMKLALLDGEGNALMQFKKVD